MYYVIPYSVSSVELKLGTDYKTGHDSIYVDFTISRDRRVTDRDRYPYTRA